MEIDWLFFRRQSIFFMEKKGMASINSCVAVIMCFKPVIKPFMAIITPLKPVITHLMVMISFNTRKNAQRDLIETVL